VDYIIARVAKPKKYVSGGSLRAARLWLFFGSLIWSLAACEIVVRIAFADEIDTYLLRERNARTNFESFTRPSSHPGLLYEFKPAVSVEWGGCRVVTDAEGFARISPRETTTACGPGSVRIALLGDSTSFGWRVEYEQTYGELVRRKLEEHTGKATELRNFSLPGYNSQHLRVVLEDRVLPWQPDLVILHYDHNDADPIDAKPPGYLEPTYGDNLLRSGLLKLVLRRIRRSQTEALTTVAGEDPESPDRFFSSYRFAGAQYELHWQEMERIANLLDAHGIPALAFIFNTWLKRTENPQDDPYFTLLHGPARQRLEELGFVVVDMYPHAQDLMRKKGWRNLSPTWFDSRWDGHPNPEGHEFIAAILVKALAEDPRFSDLFR